MFVIKQNDTLPILEAQMIDANGEPLNLALCGVQFHMRSQQALKIDRPASIVDEAKGIVQVDWQQGDTGTPGTYYCEFEIDLPDGKVITVPNDGYFKILVVAELA